MSPLPFAKPYPWSDGPDDEGGTWYMLRSKIPVTRFVVVCPYMLGDVEHLMVLSPVLWTAAEAEAAREAQAQAFADCAVLALDSLIDVGNAAHDAALLQACKRLGGQLGGVH